ncbi:MAG: thiamine pyrophosphate-dependent dehydrogenase E1 component subunit alpha [Bdellovibrionales bacterium]|nr:thiamine pyrophosphate-dependent dehydrogenase E1 component subunit alpha [Bdellovibrionales bacterium]
MTKKGSKMAHALPKAKLLQLHDLMVKSRCLEERLIKIYKAGEAFFWIGGPGEEAFGVALGLLVNKGQGIDHDYLHLHYRCTPTLVAMGMPMIDSIRLIMNRATDPCTGGRNFSNHYCFPEWNVVPVTSPIEVQYSFSVGTAMAQKRQKAKGISIVTGGDAGTAEGDFASCLVWASRPEMELPLLITVQNNGWGISTNYDSQHGEKYIADRGKAFGIKTMVINGNDPVESYTKLREAIDYVRKNKKPLLLEAKLSRLYGHSSADGASRRDVECPIEIFEKKLIASKILTKEKCDEIRLKYDLEARQAMEQVRTESPPTADSIWNNIYANNENANWREF